MTKGKEMGHAWGVPGRVGEELGRTEYRCWKEQELGSGRWGLKWRGLGLDRAGQGSPCRFLSREVTTVYPSFRPTGQASLEALGLETVPPSISIL